MMAAQRSRDVATGATLSIDRDNDKNPVVALREIAAPVPAYQSTVLRHLPVMRRHGVVVRRKGSHEDLYAVADSTMIELCRTICRQMAERCAARATRSEDDIQRPAAPQ